MLRLLRRRPQPLTLTHPVRRRHTPRDQYHRRRLPPPPPLPSPSDLSHAISQLPPRFSTSDAVAAISSQRNPQLSLHLFRFALHRLPPSTPLFLTTIKILASHRLLPDFVSVADHAVAVPAVASEELYNTIIYFYAENRLLSKAIAVYRLMRDSKDLTFRPSLRTYNLLFAALLGKEGNSFINHMYMDNVRALFKQMVESGVEPDVLALNSVIRGYVMSLHVNDALRVFHQMGVVYKCLPDGNTYNWIVHGLCSQGRSRNARELAEEMKGKGFVVGERTYNSMVNAMVLSGEVDKGLEVLWEMVEVGRRVDEVTFRTVLGEVCRQGRVEESVGVLRELRRRGVVDEAVYWDLMRGLQSDFGGGDGEFEGRRGFRRRS